MLSTQNTKKDLKNEKELIPCLFSWCEGGREVYLVGSFINWDMNKKLKMDKCNGEFLLTLLLEKEIYTYKFLVDGQLKCSSSVATMRNSNGDINNVVDMKNYIPFNFELKKDQIFQCYKKIWKYSKQNNFDIVSRITPIPLYLENSRDIIKLNLSTPSFLSESLCNHMYFDTDSYKNYSSNIIEVCVVVKSEYNCKKGEKRKILTKYNILSYFPTSKNDDFVGSPSYNPLKHLISFNH
ncbi:5'-AMP-activated protein kinase subunit beta-1, putative [Plasmodium gallinaceum]|uniref:5'-AMP-activated protein kinase subunit beta-1, putative n=1 Tax=Plasmodium gallinaceum TaxID=5849 RepID=A0A1J1GRM9_PLAGA|nr:5'-AMP-activated protein kinase subunit beta-1, putative [Plasmodium gallinaceum]CRG93944.1 5'-AMP-activated protein kinase subunit beta-1, putative [Plasmodium gallinaceum]